jgi:hypothetical protein
MPTARRHGYRSQTPLVVMVPQSADQGAHPTPGRLRQTWLDLTLLPSMAGRGKTGIQGLPAIPALGADDNGRQRTTTHRQTTIAAHPWSTVHVEQNRARMRVSREAAERQVSRYPCSNSTGRHGIMDPTTCPTRENEREREPLKTMSVPSAMCGCMCGVMCLVLTGCRG